MLVGLLLAFGAALTTGVASVLQAIAARQRPIGNVAGLVVAPLYLGGTGLDVLGFACTLGALHWLPLFLVQCAAASSVGVTALVGRRVLGAVLHPRDLWALLGLGGGLVLLAAGARPEAATAISDTAQWLLLASTGPALAVGFALTRHGGARAGGLLAAVAGLAFAGTSIASRILSNAHSVLAIVRAPASYALVAFGIGGMIFFAAGLQRAAVTIATAAMFGVQTIAASAVGLTALGDATRAGFEVPTAIGFVAALGGALALALSESTSPRSPAAHRAVPAGFADS
jgi:hypothetical protein